MVSKGKSASECFRLAELSGITFCLPWLAKVTPVSAALRMEKHLLLSLAANCWPDSTVPKWPSAFPNALLQDSAAAEFGRCWSASVTPGRAERTLITAQVCLVLFVGFFEAASVICRWEGKLLLPDFCSASAVTEVCPGMLVPSALSCKKGTWRCNYSSDSSFESSSGGSGFSLSVWDCTDAWSCLLWTTWSLPEQSYACFKDQGDRNCMVKAHWEFTFCDSQPSVLSILRWALSVTEDLLMCF